MEPDTYVIEVLRRAAAALERDIAHCHDEIARDEKQIEGLREYLAEETERLADKTYKLVQVREALMALDP